MNFLRLLTPINLQEEKERFFADNSYNPQFQYAGEIEEEKLAHYGVPQQNYLDLASSILEKAYHNKTETDLTKLEGKILTQQKVTEKIETFLSMHGLLERYTIQWSPALVARASIDATTLRLKTTAKYQEESVLGLLYHEIGTHALRQVNYEQQPWYKKKKKNGFSDYLRTEEGLAGLHSLLPKKNKLAYTSAIRYLTVKKAQDCSFVEVWNYLATYIDDLETRWMVCVKAKRGLKDTGKPGGYTKDLVYFEGILETWEWLKNHDFDIEPLYLGKLAAKDAEKARMLNPDFKPTLPTFFHLNKETYRDTLRTIGRENELL